MKKLYWRPSKVPKIALLFTSVVSIAFISLIEVNEIYRQLPYYQEKIQAASLMKDAMQAIKENREKNFGPVDESLDPTKSGLIGLTSSITTSNTGYLSAKRTAINPNWAAVLVMMLKQTGAKPGDYIAIGASGSFPSLTIAALAAAQALKLNPITITSVAASNWGANIPGLTWLDMERVLFDKGIIFNKSVAASLGGNDDDLKGLPPESRASILEAITRNAVSFIPATNFIESIDERMAVYKKYSGGQRIAAYINVGGGEASVGSNMTKHVFLPGLNLNNPAKSKKHDGVMKRFASMGTPVIHLSSIERIADEYGLPKSPNVLPKIGEGAIYGSNEYNRVLAICLLLFLFVIMYTLLRLDIGYRIFGALRPISQVKPPEPMI